MERDDNILAGLALLDPANDEHWTGSGLPRVDAVVSLSGEEGVTRLDINTLAPDLNKETAPDLTPDDQTDEDDSDQDDLSADDPVVENVPDDSELQQAALMEEIDACKGSIEEKQAERDQAISDIRALEATCAILETRYAALFPPVEAVVAVQAYQQRSKAQREARVASARRAPGAAKSQLDRAMMVRRGFGQNRPEGFLIDGG